MLIEVRGILGGADCSCDGAQALDALCIAKGLLPSGYVPNSAS